MKTQLLKITFIAMIIFSFSSINAQDSVFENSAEDDSNWSTVGNWTAGLPTGLAELSDSPVLDTDQSIFQLRSIGSGDRMISGTSTLTINGATNPILHHNGYGLFTVDCKIDISTASKQRIDVRSYADTQLVFGPNSTLTLNTSTDIRNFSPNDVEFNGKLAGSETLTISTTGGSDIIKFNATADNVDFSGVINTYLKTIESDIIAPKLFLPSSGTMSFNHAAGVLTLNSANTMEGNLSRDSTTSGTSVVNFNGNQDNMGTLTLNGSAGVILQFNIDNSVTNLTFSGTNGDWDAAELDIVGFANDVIKINSTLSASQLAQITHDGIGGALGQRATGEIVYATALSVKENTLSGIRIYPSPVAETLNIESPVGSLIEMYNVIGVKVKSIDNANGLQKMSVSDLKSGLYFVKISDGGKVFQDKIIKN